MVEGDEEVVITKNKEQVEEAAEGPAEVKASTSYAEVAGVATDADAEVRALRARVQELESREVPPNSLGALVAELREARIESARQAREDRAAFAALIKASRAESESSTSVESHPLAGHYAPAVPHNLFGNDKSAATSWEPRLLALDQDLPARLIRDKSGPKAQREYHTLVSACHFLQNSCAQLEWLAELLEEQLTDPEDPSFVPTEDVRVRGAFGALNTLRGVQRLLSQRLNLVHGTAQAADSGCSVTPELIEFLAGKVYDQATITTYGDGQIKSWVAEFDSSRTQATSKKLATLAANKAGSSGGKGKTTGGGKKALPKSPGSKQAASSKSG